MFTQRMVHCEVVRSPSGWLSAVRSASSEAIRMLCCALLFFLAVFPAAAQSNGKILGHTYLGSFPNGAETLVTIDPGTGAVSSLGSVPNSGSLSVQFAIAALESAQHHYFFLDFNSVLHQMDTQTGVEITEIHLSIPVFLAGMRFDSSSGKPFGHAFLNGAWTLVSIDPVNGSVVSVGTVPNSGLLGVQGGIAALDSAQRHYFFLDANSVLHQMDIQTGIESAETPLSIRLFLAGMRFDSSSGKLFGHAFLNGAWTLVSIDPANGGVVSVGTVPNSGLLGVQGGIAALDSAQHHYFFLDANSVLHQMDTQTGVESAEIPLSTPLSLAGMEFEPSPSPVPVSVDIKPQSCPNPLNLGAAGVLPVAILGTSTFDVTTVDASSVKLQGVSPLRSALEDVATPFSGAPAGATSCTTAGPDGFTDLVLSFSNPDVSASLGTVTDGQVIVLTLTGNLKSQFGASPIKGQDVVVIRSPMSTN